MPVSREQTRARFSDALKKLNSQRCLSLGKSFNSIFHLTSSLFSPNLYLGDKCVLPSDFIEMGYKV